ncbi:hypothetical protein KY285_000252 [Solanum tuberosum]|nr:hypothetical protein KY284_000289 [Solanum tuberosum]KAH0729076.1 hypothetical protein KY289_000264 [Solanum tuberosum]KAH0764381.1 hypothetical protein KY285_000252 [Solanum tuberosum]
MNYLYVFYLWNFWLSVMKTGEKVSLQLKFITFTPRRCPTGACTIMDWENIHTPPARPACLVEGTHPHRIQWACLLGSCSLLFGLSVHVPIAPGREGVVELHIDWGWTGRPFFINPPIVFKKSWEEEGKKKRSCVRVVSGCEEGRALNRAGTPTQQNNKLRATPSVVASSSVHVNVYCDRQTAAARCGGGAAKGGSSEIKSRFKI